MRANRRAEELVSDRSIAQISGREDVPCGGEGGNKGGWGDGEQDPMRVRKGRVAGASAPRRTAEGGEEGWVNQVDWLGGGHFIHYKVKGLHDSDLLEQDKLY